MFYSTLSLVFCLENSRRLGIWFFPKTTSNLLMCRKNAPGEGKTYSETRENREHQKYFWNVIVLLKTNQA